jgi:hypothetical protein
MIPKEKAEELMAKFMAIKSTKLSYFSVIYLPVAKLCALIAVDEILKSNPIVPLSYMLESEALDAAIEYWQEVKQEIEKL